MSGNAVERPRERTDAQAHVRLSERLAGPVLCRLVSMLLVRSDWPIDRLDDAMLACDALCAHAYSHTMDGRLALDVSVSDKALELHVRELAPDGACALVREAELPGVGNVLEHISESISIEQEGAGGASALVLVISSESRS